MSTYQMRLLQRRAQFVQRWLDRLSRTSQSANLLASDPSCSQQLRQVNKDLHQLAGAAGIYELEEVCTLAISGEEICLSLLQANRCPDGKHIPKLQEIITALKQHLLLIGRADKEQD